MRMRLYAPCAIAATLYVTYAEPLSLANRVISSTGQSGWWCVALLTLLVFVAIVNGLFSLVPGLPHIRQFSRSLHRILFMAISCGLVSMGGVVLFALGWTPLVIIYAVDAIGCITIAVQGFSIKQIRDCQNKSLTNTPQ